MNISEDKNGTIRITGKCSLADAMGGISKRFLESAAVHERCLKIAEDTNDRVARAAAEQRLITALRRGRAFVEAAGMVPASRRSAIETWDVRGDAVIVEDSK